MTNLEQLSKAYSDFYDGIPWYGKNFKEIVDDLTFGEASAVAGNGQSIAQLLCHINKWRRSLTIRLQGNTDIRVSDTDADNWPPINTLNEEAWENAKKEFGELQQIIVEELAKREEAFLDEIFVPGNGSLYLSIFDYGGCSA